MKWLKNIWVFLFLVLAIPFGLHFIMNYFESNQMDLPILGPKTIDEAGKEIPHTIPEFEFLDQDSVIFNSSSLDDKIWVGNYFFTSCPTICPTMMRNLQIVHENILDEDDVEIVSFTVDPKRDLPSRLKNYTKKVHAIDNKWHLLTGEKIDLYRLARNGLLVSATDGDGGPSDFIHSENFVLIDKDGRIRFFYDGTDSDQVEQLVKDIFKLKRKRS